MLDAEEVVGLYIRCINKWRLGLNIKILLKAKKVILGKEGLREE